MVENSIHTHPSDPPIGRLEEDIDDPNFAQYRCRRSRPAEISSDEPVPLFLYADPDGHDREDPPTRRRAITPSRIVTVLVAASAAAMVLTLLSGDAARTLIVKAKASFAGTSSAGTSPAELNATPPASAPAVPPDFASASSDQPSRDDIAAAYQAAIKSQVMARETPAVQPPPIARRLDADELAALLKRARGLLAIGDIVSARLLLERAADAQEASAALLLARTYDPEVLGTPDARSITPDPAKAREWYRKAAELGSPDAQQRLAQMQD